MKTHGIFVYMSDCTKTHFVDHCHTWRVVRAGSLEEMSDFLRVIVMRLAVRSLSRIRPVTFCPGLKRDFSFPPAAVSLTCAFGTNALHKKVQDFFRRRFGLCRSHASLMVSSVVPVSICFGTSRRSSWVVPNENNSAEKLLQLHKSNLASSRLYIPHTHSSH